ncbi:hypothetical protein J2X06_003330 [Lysobacter niastensis]|uniref:Sel1 repeat family protein n=1 Tax=Lysobacter niastensis TaxID=380629 RepID=A0ABU1WFF7_9GAMM|nr:hypothetical protein [Lysobacter niastensis]MDR7136112.1 hypothetical protein [Lysobacter niastensis]
MGRPSLLLIFATCALLSCAKHDSDNQPKSALPGKLRAAADAAASTSPTGSAPLPHSLYLKDDYPQLIARSQNGDARATCQLATNLDFCAGAEEDAKRLGEARERIEQINTSNPSKQGTLATFTELARLRGEYCVGVPTASPSERVRYWRRAAMAGHLPSLLHYASGRAFRSNETLALLDELKAFRSEALPMMKEAATSGSFQANVMLARVYSPERPPNRAALLEQAVGKKDKAKALAYFMVAEQIARQGGGGNDPDARLVPHEIEVLQRFMTEDEIVASNQVFRELMARQTALGATDPGAESRTIQEGYLAVPETTSCEKGTLLGRSR